MNSTTADDSAKPAKAKGKGGGFARIMLIFLAFVAGAAAGGFGVVAAVSQLGLGGGKVGHADVAKVETGPVEYVDIDNAFTSNLVDTGRYLQLRISVSTKGGEAVTAAIDTHKPALVSTVLAVLGELSEADVADRPAKDKLRARLKVAINDVLRARGVPGTVDEVFFTSLVVQ
jgi:flagellar basal body-associated protein FliL